MKPATSIGTLMIDNDPLDSNIAGDGNDTPLEESVQTSAAAIQSVPMQHSNPWDAAHTELQNQELQESPGLRAHFAEPNLQQQFPVLRNKSPAPAAFCADKPSSNTWPAHDDFAWHLAEEFSQLQSAREKVRQQVGANPTKRVRIAILDTGYDPAHQSLPEFINLDLARNFVEGENPNNAVDPAANPTLESVLSSPGHGTATIALLAGRRVKPRTHPTFDDYMGAAAFCEVVPIRVADSVVHFYSKAMAEAINYAVDIGCDVISISMGGVPSRSWAKAVNRAYEAGVVICAAAGNNVGGLPTRQLVFPARFRRVLAVCGATSDKSPYYKHFGHGGMQGNFGPAKTMGSAITAFTPNTPWAEIGCPEAISQDGAGTSSATPQVAAAAALWIQMHMPEKPAEPWRRVEAVRNALFSTADKTRSSKHFGNGLLRAADALAIAANLNLPKTKADHGWFPWIRVLLREESIQPEAEEQTPREEMLQLEAFQLFLTSPAMEDFADKDPQSDHLGEQEQAEVMRALIDDPRTSEALRSELKTRIR